MSHPVIPAPVRFDGDAGQFTLRSGTTVAYTDPAVAPIVERFCSEITRRTGLRLGPLAGNPGPSEPSVRIELATGDELGVLPAPLGVSPTGDGPADERHALAINGDRVVVRAVEPVGVARGLTTLGWQESARAGLGPDDLIQYWYTEIALAASLPAEVRAQAQANLAMSRRDVETAVAASVPVIVSPLSHCYFDVPYAEPSADPAQAERQERVGLRLYSPMTVAESFDWAPAEALGAGRAAQVAGVEAAIWAETIADFDDLSFLLLPRLPGVAHKAWSDPQAATWTDHRERLAWHDRLWAQDDLAYFRASTVDWRKRPGP
jgi:hypothetical protein